MSTWYSCSSITFAFHVSGILGNSSLAVFSHPRLPKHRQARISPQICEAGSAKTSPGSNFPKIPKILASMRREGAVVAELSGISGKLEPGDDFALPASQILGKLEPGDVFASEVAKTSPGSNFPKIPKILASMRREGP